jgi:hypothetical protein
VKPTQRGSVLHFWVHVLYTTEGCDKGAGIAAWSYLLILFLVRDENNFGERGWCLCQTKASFLVGRQLGGWLVPIECL